MLLIHLGDGIKAERIVCQFRKIKGPYLIAGSGAHRAQRVIIEGLPAEAWIEKPIRLA